MLEGERLEIQPMGRGVTQDCIFWEVMNGVLLSW